MKRNVILLFALRLAGWVALTTLIVFTVAPASFRPESHLPNELEHFGSFFVASVLNSLGYPRRLAVSVIVAITFTGGIEVLQIPLPSRHARLIDFTVDALAACAGCIVSLLLMRTGLFSQITDEQRRDYPPH